MRVITYSTRSPVWNKPILFEKWKRVEHPFILNANGPTWISTFGRVANENKNQIIIPWNRLNKRTGRLDPSFDYDTTIIENGKIKRKNMAVSRAIMLLFYPIPNPKEFEVNHIDGNTMHNFIYNLAWCLKRENIMFAYMNGQMTYHDKDGNRVVKSILNPNTVDEICRLICKGLYYGQIADMVGVTYQQVYSIAQGRTYKDKYNQFKLYEIEQPLEQLSDEQLDTICKLLVDGRPHEYISNMVGCAKSTVSAIKNGTINKEYYDKYNLENLRTRDTTRLTKEKKEMLKTFVIDNESLYNSKNDLYRDALRYVGYDAPDKLSPALRQFVMYTSKYRNTSS